MRGSKNLKILFITLGVVLVAATRFLPTMFNLSALGGLALFSGVALKRNWFSVLIPFAALFITDLLLNNIVYSAYYEGFVWFTGGAVFIYGSYLVMIALGWLIGNDRRIISVIGASIAGSIAFFLITNFGAWLSGGLYTKDIAGLIESYVAGIPFFRNTLAGNVVFSVLLINGYSLAKTSWISSKSAA